MGTADQKYFITSTVQVSKEVYKDHVMKEHAYWSDRKIKEMEDHKKQVSTLKNRQQKRLLEFDRIILNKKKELQRLSVEN